ncbi:RNA 2'-phosphotransferase, partial [Flavihumibacter sp. CACIAM 22H1]|uniref:RNA 2'-phosphotransferase n=1 Tax=Flavihumibacter sp. CACIAM 22H1 TaxID=1812911 RepID=UPI0025BEB255
DIKAGGLRKMNRLHVHLSIDEASAFLVGQRKGKPVILEINARQMQDDGLVFYKSENDVWLTDAVAPHYIQFPV